MHAPPLRDWAEKKYGTDKVKILIQEMNAAAQEMNQENIDFVLSFYHTKKRLDILTEKEQNIEYIHLLHPLIEYGMKLLIKAFEFSINFSLRLADLNTSLKIYSTNLDEGANSYGRLFGMLKKYLDGNNPLMQKLQSLNGMKIEVGHDLYKKYIDPDIVNQNIANYIKSDPAKELIELLSDKHKELYNDLTIQLKEFGVGHRVHSEEEIQVMLNDRNNKRDV